MVLCCTTKVFVQQTQESAQVNGSIQRVVRSLLLWTIRTNRYGIMLHSTKEHMKQTKENVKVNEPKNGSNDLLGKSGYIFLMWHKITCSLEQSTQTRGSVGVLSGSAKVVLVCSSRGKSRQTHESKFSYKLPCLETLRSSGVRRVPQIYCCFSKHKLSKAFANLERRRTSSFKCARATAQASWVLGQLLGHCIALCIAWALGHFALP